MKGATLEGLHDNCGGNCGGDCCGGSSSGNADKAININISNPINIGSRNNSNSRNKVPGQAGGVYHVPDNPPAQSPASAPAPSAAVIRVPVPVAVPIVREVNKYIDIVPDPKPVKVSTVKKYYKEFP